jgi:hypothetical protein
MFRAFLARMAVTEAQAQSFHYYLNRHVHLDEDFHAPLSLRLLAALCAGDAGKWREAEGAGLRSMPACFSGWRCRPAQPTNQSGPICHNSSYCPRRTLLPEGAVIDAAARPSATPCSPTASRSSTPAKVLRSPPATLSRGLTAAFDRGRGRSADKAWGLEPQSRLSCQARVNAADLVIEIPKYTINMVKEGH